MNIFKKIFEIICGVMYFTLFGSIFFLSGLLIYIIVGIITLFIKN